MPKPRRTVLSGVVTPFAPDEPAAELVVARRIERTI